MNRVPIKSSNIVSAGYDPAKRLLEIQFTSGIYRYEDVPLAVYNALMAAESVGSFVHKQIRPFYVAAKVEEKCPACDQSGVWQTGEYPCKRCGRATVHDTTLAEALRTER